MVRDTPYIDFHNAKSTANFSARIISDGANRLHIQQGGTPVALPYNGRSITPLTYHEGTFYASVNIESAGYFMNNVGAAGGGYYVYGGNNKYGRLYIATIGTAATASNASTPGITMLELGNGTAPAAAGATGTNPGIHNAYGVLRLYGNNASYTNIIAQANGNRAFYLPNYADTMYAVHAGNNNAVGSGTNPVYVAANGRVTACTYSLSATIPSATANYIPYYSGANTISTDDSFLHTKSDGTATALGKSVLTLGNVTPSGTAGNRYGILRLYSSTDVKVDIYTMTRTSDKTIKIPDASGWAAVGAEAGVGSATKPVFLSNAGAITACTYSLNATIPTGAANKMLFYSAANTLTTGHYITSSAIGVNRTSNSITPAGASGATGFAFAAGTSYFTGNVWSEYDIISNVAEANRGFHLRHNMQFYSKTIVSALGTTSDGGVAQFFLGNNLATGTAENARGEIYVYQSSGRIGLWMYGNGEGGNIRIYSPSATFYEKNSAGTIVSSAQYWEMDAFDGNLRFYTYQQGSTSAVGAIKGISFNRNADINCDGKVNGAVWNDYAEYRATKEDVAPGKCVIEIGDGTLETSTERLQPGANIVSDTFGFSIGQTETCKTPLAVSGRVLAYPFEDRNEFKPGDAVCSGPDGTVSIMTREEIVNYPERIVGTVSEIPSYETWGTNDAKVDGRIWIKVK